MSPESAEIVSCSELARRLDCDESTVRRYVREGKIYGPAVVYKPTGKVAGLRFEMAKVYYLEARETTEYRFASSGGAPTGSVRKRAKLLDADPINDGKPLAYFKCHGDGVLVSQMAELRRHALQLKVELAELELGIQSGTLLLRESVFQELFVRGQEIRARFEAIPDRVIDILLAAPSPEAARTILQVEIDETLAFVDATIVLPLKTRR